MWQSTEWCTVLGSTRSLIRTASFVKKRLAGTKFAYWNASMFVDPLTTDLDAQKLIGTIHLDSYYFLLSSLTVTFRFKHSGTVVYVFCVYIQAIPINKIHGYTPENISRRINTIINWLGNAYLLNCIANLPYKQLLLQTTWRQSLRDDVQVVLRKGRKNIKTFKPE